MLFKTEIRACLSSAETSGIDLKLKHVVQNGLGLHSNIFCRTVTCNSVQNKCLYSAVYDQQMA